MMPVTLACRNLLGLLIKMSLKACIRFVNSVHVQYVEELVIITLLEKKG